MSSRPPRLANVAPALVEAWRVDTASPAELRRGYARFVRRRPTARAWPRLLARVVAGLVLGVGLAQAASMVQARWLAPREPLHSVGELQRGARTAPLGRVGRETALVSPAPSLSQAPPVLPHALSRVSAVASVASSASFVQEQWQRAAAALRAHDFSRAEAAFVEIERSAASADADAARLARAQLLASYGRGAEARELTRDLQEHAQSALVRDKARALWNQLSEKSAEHRSAEPPAAIKQP